MTMDIFKLSKVIAWFFNVIGPCAAEWFATVFLSFEAGIFDTISSFKWRKITKKIYIYISQIELSEQLSIY